MPGWFRALFVHVQMGNFFVRERGGSERLPGWFVNFLGQFGGVKKSKQGYPFANLNIEYLMHILIAGRVYSCLGNGHIHGPLFKKGLPLAWKNSCGSDA